MAEGKLPNLEAAGRAGRATTGSATTYPSMTPVAWSSFSTGTNPAKHNIFDFLDRDLQHLPAGALLDRDRQRRQVPAHRQAGRIPLAKPEIRLLRKSRPFWTILGEHGIWSTVLRVPITFPPERFYGAELSAMCVPDLLGTQGTFLLFTTRTERLAVQGGRAPRRRSTGAGDRYSDRDRAARRTSSAPASRRSRSRSRSSSTAPRGARAGCRIDGEELALSAEAALATG